MPFIAKQVMRWRKEYEEDLRTKREPLLPAAWVAKLSADEAALKKLSVESMNINEFKARSRL